MISSFASSCNENMTGCFDVELTLHQTEPVLNTTYTNLFRLENLDHEQGVEEQLRIFVTYNVSWHNETYNNSFLKTINSYSTTGTGTFTFSANTSHLLCGEIRNISQNGEQISDPHPENNVLCTAIVFDNTSNATVNETGNATNESEEGVCNQSVRFLVLQALSNHSFQFKPIISAEQHWTLTYWIEDLDGVIFKQPMNTTNTNWKSFTPSSSVTGEKIFRLYGRLNTTCAQTENSTFLLLKRAQEENEESSESECVEDEEEQQESALSFTALPEEIIAGSTISIKVKAYRGNTLKRKVTLRGPGNQMSFLINDKYAETEVTIPFTIEKSCSLEEGPVDFILSGLDEEKIITAQLFRPTQDECQPAETNATTSSPSQNSIASFYTRKKKYAPHINFSYRLEQESNDSSILLIIPHLLLNTTTNVPAKPGNNTVFFLLKEGEDIIDFFEYQYFLEDDSLSLGESEDQKESESDSSNNTQREDSDRSPLTGLTISVPKNEGKKVIAISVLIMLGIATFAVALIKRKNIIYAVQHSSFYLHKKNSKDGKG
ncbi:MAG: hypothetical protein H6502_01155 [Candidatus Woesearchaeota archaeon]|nr:MAG: hypothetical protein H6502_01155 [Candidatus Woesearchaeota archaeon]